MERVSFTFYTTGLDSLHSFIYSFQLTQVQLVGHKKVPTATESSNGRRNSTDTLGKDFVQINVGLGLKVGSKLGFGSTLGSNHS